MPSSAESLLNIFCDEVDGRNEEKSNQGGEEDSEGEGDRHGLEELSLKGGLANEREKTGESGQRGEQNRAKAAGPSL